MLRHKHNFAILLDVAQLARATYYYHVKRLAAMEKYADLTAEIEAIRKRVTL